MLMVSQETMADQGNLDPKESLLEKVLRVNPALLEIQVELASQVREVPQGSQE